MTLNQSVYVSRFRHKERSGEQEHYLNWFKKAGFTVMVSDSLVN